MGAGMAGLSGCSGLLGGDDMPEETLTPVDLPETATRDGTRPPVGGGGDCETEDGPYDTDHPPVYDLPDAASWLEEFGCPTFEWAAKTVCHHTSDIEEEDVVLVGMEDRALVRGDAGKAVSFVLVNRGDGPVRTQPATWSVLQRDDAGNWQSVASGEPGCTRTVYSEEYHRWRVGVRTSVPAGAVNVTGLQVDLDPGIYAFAVPVLRTDRRDFVCVAPFAVRRVEPPSRTPGTVISDPTIVDQPGTGTATHASNLSAER